MMKKFAIDYVFFPQHNHRVLTHRTDDPVEAESFIGHLLQCGAKIVGIRHDAADLSPQQFDRMIKIAAESLVVNLLGVSLGADSADIRHRFGFAA
jgi:hypothetical protein